MPAKISDLFPFGDLDDALFEQVRHRLPSLPIDIAAPLIELGSAAVSLLEMMADALEEHRLSPARWRLLMAVVFQAPPTGATVGELARHLGVREPTVSATIDRLESQGLLHRTRDPSDGRVVRVTASQEAGALISRIAPQIGERMATIVQALGGPEQTKSMAETIAAAVEEARRQPRKGS